MYRRDKRGLATWAKWLIGILATLIVLGIGGCGILFFTIYKFGQDAMDPDKAKAVAQEMVTIADPLPAPFEYKMGMNMMGYVSLVTIADENSSYTYSLVKMQKPDGEKVSAEELVDQMAVEGVPSGQSATKKIDVTGKGSTPVAGIDMPYVVGTTLSNTGEKQPALMGAVVKDKDVLMLIVIGPSSQESIDLEQAKKFFELITAFK